MTRWDMERYKSKIHHHAIFTLNDGTTKEGMIQPFDDEQVAVTGLDGVGGFYIKLADIKSISFPDD